MHKIRCIFQGGPFRYHLRLGGYVCAILSVRLSAKQANSKVVDGWFLIKFLEDPDVWLTPAPVARTDQTSEWLLRDSMRV